MAVTVLDYINKLKSINVDTITATVINQNTEQIIDINQKNLDVGLNSNDVLVGTYENVTGLIAQELQLLADPRAPKKDKLPGAEYNFYWTGRLYDGIFITYRNNVIHFDSRGKGSGEKLTFVTGNKLLGVSQINAEKINFDIILPDFQNEIKKILCK